MTKVLTKKQSRSRRKRGKKKPGSRTTFQTKISTIHFSVEKGCLLPKRSGILLDYQLHHSPIDIEDGVEIKVICNGKSALILTSLDRSSYPIEIQRSSDYGYVFVFALGVLVQTLETGTDDVPVYRLISQKQFKDGAFRGSVYSEAILNYSGHDVLLSYKKA